jgi:DNA (cytosine-5)-methyltransferase 1
MSAAVRYLSVCSGIEAATVAWRPLGWSPVAFAEVEPFPCMVLAHHYPKVPNLGDITRFKEWPDLAIDLLVGGTPCQSFSVAGLRKGLADPRGNLALTYLAIADRYRPRWLLWENVPGVLSSGGGRDFGSFLGGMGELGYGFAYRVLDAQHCRSDGFGRAVPQRRRRVFVVGYLGDWRRAAAVLFDAASLHGDPAPRRGEGEEASGQPVYGVSPDCFDRSGEGARGTAAERSGLGVEHELAYSIRAKRPGGVAFGGNRTSGPLDVATAVNAHGGPHGRQDFESETFVCAPPLTSNPYGDHESREDLLVVHSLRADGFDGSEDGTGRGTPLVPVCFSGKDHGGDATEMVAPTLRSMGHDGSHANGGGQLSVTLGSAVRRLTPVECARLQGFPDDYLSQVPYRGKPPADGPIYKALGNAMAVNVVRWLGQRIAMVDAVDLRSAA